MFLAFLCYLSLVAVLGVERVLERRAAVREAEAPDASDLQAPDRSTDAATRPDGRHA